MIVAVLVVIGVVLAGLSTLGLLVIIGWIEQLGMRRRRARIAVAHQLAEQHLDRLTSDALRQMLDAARRATEGR